MLQLALALGLSWNDPSTGMTWTTLAHSVAWADAEAGCTGQGQRLPTLDEWWDAYDRLKDTDLARDLMTIQLRAWTADRQGGPDSGWIWALYLQSGNGGGVPATQQAAAACISDTTF